MSYEPRIWELERRLMAMEGELSRLQALATELNQVMPRAFMAAIPASSGSTGPALWCRTPGSVSAATGTWPNITPATFTAAVYSFMGSSSALVTSSATIRWCYKDTAAANKLVPVIPNGDGTYDALADSCTAV